MAGMMGGNGHGGMGMVHGAAWMGGDGGWAGMGGGFRSVPPTSALETTLEPSRSAPADGRVSLSPDAQAGRVPRRGTAPGSAASNDWTTTRGPGRP